MIVNMALKRKAIKSTGHINRKNKSNPLTTRGLGFESLGYTWGVHRKCIIINKKIDDFHECATKFLTLMIDIQSY